LRQKLVAGREKRTRFLKRDKNAGKKKGSLDLLWGKLVENKKGRRVGKCDLEHKAIVDMSGKRGKSYCPLYRRGKGLHVLWGGRRRDYLSKKKTGEGDDHPSLLGKRKDKKTEKEQQDWTIAWGFLPSQTNSKGGVS